MDMWKTAYIRLAKDQNGPVLAIFTNGLSYNIPNIKATTGRGQVRGCYGCKNEREAFIVAKQLAKIVNKHRPGTYDTSQWKLELL